MQKELFRNFYEGVIEAIAKQVVSNNEGFTYTRNLEGVYEEYLNQKTALKYLIKSDVVAKDDKKKILLDGHKVAACITNAIIRVRLVTSCETDDLDSDMFALDSSNRLNEQVALLCGLNCLLEYMSEEKEYLYSDDRDHTKTQLIFPKTRYEDLSGYLDSLVRGLYYSNVISNINPLLLSHIFFMIEQYHRKCVELQEYKKQT